MSDEIDEDSTMNFDLEYEELGDDSFTDTESPHSKVEVFEELSYQIIDSDQVFQEMDKLIKEVDIILQLPSKMTRMLLSHFNWNTDKVLNEYYHAQEMGTRYEILKEAGIAVPRGFFTQKSEPSSQEVMIIDPKGTTCQVCFDDFDEEEGKMIDLGCGHFYCDDCWYRFLKVNIMEEGQSSDLTCMEPECQVAVDDTTVLDIIKRQNNNSRDGDKTTDECEALTKRYQVLITQSFVQCNKNLRHCPNPKGCEFVIKAVDLVCQPILCKCGHYFCFKCSQDWHEPVNCDYLKQWNKKAADDSETLNWITANTKLCPKCEATIEKNGGCNHMRCSKCSTEFCWSCMTAWASHNHSMGCTTYREENDASKAETKKMAELSLKRYLFYFERFNNHRQSLGFEQDLRTNVKEKAEQLQICSNLCHVDTLFLLEAVDDLCRCRQTLMYTYIFAYFLKEDNNAEIFIENQKDLQRAVEELSGFLERDITEITTENMSQTKRRVIDLAVYCRGRRDTLVSHIKEGYDHNSWQYIDFSPQM